MPHIPKTLAQQGEEERRKRDARILPSGMADDQSAKKSLTHKQNRKAGNKAVARLQADQAEAAFKRAMKAKKAKAAKKRSERVAAIARAGSNPAVAIQNSSAIKKRSAPKKRKP